MSRRATKATVTNRSTHLDLVDDDAGIGGSSKIHKRKAKSKADLVRAIFCAVAALTTLYFIYFISNGALTAKRFGMSKGQAVDVRTRERKEEVLPPQQHNLPPDSIYRTRVKDIHDEWKHLMDYSGSVSLIVNVACE